LKPVRRLIFSAFAITCVVACGEEPTENYAGAWAGATKIVTAPVELRPLIDDIEALGTARANESIEIKPRIASIVDQIAFEEGQVVQQGDLLIELENSEIVAGLALARASLSESKSIYGRSKSLASSQSISASNLDQLHAQVKIDEAHVQAALARLDNTRILAPFAGRVGLRRVSPGSLVTSQDVITTLDDVSRIKLDFSVPETFLTVVKKGMKIQARSIVFPDRVFEGTVISIDTRLDPVSRAVQIRALIPNDDGGLKPGMFMTVDLQRDRGKVLVVPEQSIVPEGTSQFVFVVNDGKVERRSVTIGRRIPGLVVISSGLTLGERVITEGTGKVRDGSQVEDIADADI
jgi:membrane fusion protein (multidrug efflux system)